MKMNLKGKSLLTLKDFSKEEILFLLDRADRLKRKKKSGKQGKLLRGKNIVLLFEKTSTRTRCAFESAVYDEGGHVTFLTNSQMGKKESIEDTAKFLGRIYDGFEFRGFQQETVKTLAKHSGVPVWNGLTDLYHPTQILADLMTMREYFNKPLDQLKLAYIGDGRNNMANSFLIGAAKTGLNLSIVAPSSLFPSDDLVAYAKKEAEKSGSVIEITDDPIKGVIDADVLYTDVWVSMGEEALFEERIKLLTPYRVDLKMMENTGNKATVFMHCLPAYHNVDTETGQDIFNKFGIKEMEVSDEVFRSKQSIVFDQAENRMHTIKAVMVTTQGK